MGPFSKLWLKLENGKKSDAPPLSLDKILSLLEQTICLLGQPSNSISYHWRYNILRLIEAIKEKTGTSAGRTRVFKAVADFKVKLSPT